jgi:hypothetical protein
MNKTEKLHSYLLKKVALVIVLLAASWVVGKYVAYTYPVYLKLDSFNAFLALHYLLIVVLIVFAIVVAVVALAESYLPTLTIATTSALLVVVPIVEHIKSDGWLIHASFFLAVFSVVGAILLKYDVRREESHSEPQKESRELRKEQSPAPEPLGDRCPDCGGRGEIASEEYDPGWMASMSGCGGDSGSYTTVYHPCSRCGGTGRIASATK